MHCPSDTLLLCFQHCVNHTSTQGTDMGRSRGWMHKPKCPEGKLTCCLTSWRPVCGSDKPGHPTGVGSKAGVSQHMMQGPSQILRQACGIIYIHRQTKPLFHCSCHVVGLLSKQRKPHNWDTMVCSLHKQTNLKMAVAMQRY